jgi:hypothetical protein
MEVFRLMTDKPGVIVVAVGLGVIAILVEMGSAIGYAYYGHVSFDQFIANHPFDVLSVAAWFAAGTWLAHHIRSLLGVIGLSYGLAIAGLVSVLAESESLTDALVQAAVAGTALAILVGLVLLVVDGGGGPPGWAHTGEAVWFMVAAAGVALYLEFKQPETWAIPFGVLVLAAGSAMIAGRLVSRHGLRPGPLGALVDAMKAPAKAGQTQRV